MPARARADLRGNRVAMIFQEPMTSLNPAFTIGDQIGEAVVRHRGATAAEAEARALAMLDLVRIPAAAERLRAYPHELSGGMRQRAMIAMALANDPELLIADEPTTALDVTIQAQILSLIAGLQRETGTAMILITHDLGVVAEVADDVAVMYAGRAVETGPVERSLRRPAAPLYDRPHGLDAGARPPHGPARHDPGLRAAAGRHAAGLPLRHALSLRGCALLRRAAAAARFRRPPRRRLLVRAARDHGRSRRVIAAPEASILEAVALEKHFVGRRRGFFVPPASVRAVDGVSLRVRRGETLALVGESGSGKSTLGRLMLDLMPPTAGDVLYEGRNVGSLPAAEKTALRRDLGIVFQDPFASLNPRMSVAEIVGEPIWLHQSLSRSGRRHKAAELLRTVGLRPEHGDRYPHEFSGGQRQRIGIARALASSPKLLLGDEPVSALDVSVQAQIVNLLEDLKDEFGLTLLVVAHGLGVIRHMSDRVAVMYLGQIVELAPVDALFEDPLHPYSQALLASVPVPDPQGPPRPRAARRRPPERHAAAARLPVPHPLPPRPRRSAASCGRSSRRFRRGADGVPQRGLPFLVGDRRRRGRRRRGAAFGRLRAPPGPLRGPVEDRHRRTRLNRGR